MQTGPDERARLDRDGDLYFPGRCGRAEAERLVAAVPARCARHDAFDAPEMGSDALRTGLPAQLRATVARLARHPRRVRPAACPAA